MLGLRGRFAAVSQRMLSNKYGKTASMHCNELKYPGKRLVSAQNAELVRYGSHKAGSDWNANSKIQQQAEKWHQQHSNTPEKPMTIQVDRSGLKQPSDAHPELTEEQLRQKSDETPLVHALKAMIQLKGPLTVSEFMQRALSHPEHGYYMKGDVFGTKGDFTTAPEISQMFGELIAIWCLAVWQEMGMPSAIKVVEMGPGRGSLMTDFLRAARSFPPFYEAIELHMVDTSPALQKMQQQALGCEPLPEDGDKIRMQIPDGPVVQWHTDFNNVPRGPSLIIAQELFDALPVHQFEYTERGWCERLVDIDYSDGPDHFRFVLSPGPTPATRVYIGRRKLFDPSQSVEAAAAEGVPRLDDPSLAREQPITSTQAQVGDCIEISPVGIALAQDMAQRISDHGGAALIVDYGHDHPSSLSLRGIQNHKFVSPLQEPGNVDLSIDVDFATLRKFATEGRDDVVAHGPVGQGDFLQAMGIDERLTILQGNATPEERQDLQTSYERLVHADQMGTIFKAMAFTHKDIGDPYGFPTEEEQE